ncbi:MAG: phosphatidate cytidylyltransferase [Acidobacteria bacterium]|nr:MAG: phosphatidate cytidylyltransferase [Acidobacteriota bacterium]
MSDPLESTEHAFLELEGSSGNAQLMCLFGGVLGILVLASVIGVVLKRNAKNDAARATIENLNARTRAWWKMCAIFALTLLIGRVGSLVLFGLLSLLALREYITLVPTRRGDHRTLLWSFFIITPLQYYLIGIAWYGFFAIMIPVFAFVFVPTRIAMSGDTEHFLERAAKIQFGLMICAFCLSHAPALLILEIPGFAGRNAQLLLYLVLVDQMSDVLQYVWGKLAGKHKIAPSVSPNKTWEGFLGGVATATLLGAALWWATPFAPLQAAGMSLVITLLGFAGGLVMSAIKRDAGVKDFGAVIEGHGGILDRIDSLCFAAPIFFHLVRYFFTP